MFRVTTPTHKFIFSEPVADCTELLATYSQYGQIVVEKHKADFTFETEESDGGTVYTASVTLTQEETKQFKVKLPERNEGTFVQCQIRILYSNGTALASDIVNVRLNDVLNDGILT